MRLNLGCGEFYAPGWTNVDVYDGNKVDVVASITNLPFEDNSAIQVYCGHVLEHIFLEDLPIALQEIERVLHPTGKFLIVGPDISKTSDPILKRKIARGGHRWPGDEHRWISTEEGMLAHLHRFWAYPIPVNLVDNTVWPIVSYAKGQFAIICENKYNG